MLDSGRPIAPSRVAPRAGAWIETCTGGSRRVHTARRPPCGGVDRNSGGARTAWQRSRSPPVRGRGSKLGVVASLARRPRVAPRAGAWIETHVIHTSATHRSQSPPVRGRGLKHIDRTATHVAARPVAPRAGAWIETRSAPHAGTIASGRPPCGGVDRNAAASRYTAGTVTVAPRAGAWIETGRSDALAAICARRPPCGGVDRNRAHFAERIGCDESPPVRGRGSKHGQRQVICRAVRRPPCGGVD